MSAKDKHVVPRKDGWAVRSAGASKVAKAFDTKGEAVQYARSFAKKEHGELYIHGKDGTIKERQSFGKNSMPPKSRK